MTTAKRVSICVCCILAASAVWAQSASGTARSGILGYLDPQTGAFRPVPQVQETPDVALTTAGGTFVVTLTITVKSLALSSILCSVDVSVSDAHTYFETASVKATGTGATRTCKITIPYSWQLVTPASDTVTISYGIAATGTNPLTRGSTSSIFLLPPLKVPANGATTNETAAGTI